MTDDDPVRASSIRHSFQILGTSTATPTVAARWFATARCREFPALETIHAAVARVPRTRPSAAHVALLAEFWMRGFVCWAANFATELSIEVAGITTCCILVCVPLRQVNLFRAGALRRRAHNALVHRAFHLAAANEAEIGNRTYHRPWKWRRWPHPSRHTGPAYAYSGGGPYTRGAA